MSLSSPAHILGVVSSLGNAACQFPRQNLSFQMCQIRLIRATQHLESALLLLCRQSSVSVCLVTSRINLSRPEFSCILDRQASVPTCGTLITAVDNLGQIGRQQNVQKQSSIVLCWPPNLAGSQIGWLGFSYAIPWTISRYSSLRTFALRHFPGHPSSLHFPPPESGYFL